MDFLRASHCFNVQSAALSHSFWTFSCLPATSTSNPPLLQIHFGLPPCFPMLQHPIRRFCKSLLDFLRASRCFNVQSSASANPFWTSSVLPDASTSNPALSHSFWTSSCLPATSTSNLPLSRMHLSFVNIL